MNKYSTQGLTTGESDLLILYKPCSIPEQTLA